MPNFVGLQTSDVLTFACCDFMRVSRDVKVGDAKLVRLERNFRSASKKYVAEKNTVRTYTVIFKKHGV